jgi:16S rRNA (guanine966-N2)-methyltransferase
MWLEFVIREIVPEPFFLRTLRVLHDPRIRLLTGSPSQNCSGPICPWARVAAMRIIAGEFRGRRLLPPEGTDVTRPITDRVKQSLFDILSPRIEGARVYDLFAGTGSMGLESLSRGASHATFFEADRTAVQRLKKNISTLAVGGRSNVVAGDLFRWFDAERPGATADVVFLDPPYRFLNERPQDVRGLAAAIASSHLAPDGIVVFRHDARDALDLPPLEPEDRRQYGGMALELLRKA